MFKWYVHNYKPVKAYIHGDYTPQTPTSKLSKTPEWLIIFTVMSMISGTDANQY